MNNPYPTSVEDSPPSPRSAKQVRRRLKGQVKSTKQKGGFSRRARNFHQLTMDGVTLETRCSEAWGDAMPNRKEAAVMRIAFQNIGGQPRLRNNTKTHALAERIQKESFCLQNMV
jgi:hypothetical protein